MVNYQPLVFLSYAVEYHFAGLSPGVYHLTNVLIHIINVLLVFILLKNLSGKPEVALIAASLFALSPLRVESVTWVTTRRDVLYTFFYLLAVIQYVKYLSGAGKIKKIHYSFALVFFLFSCMSKGMAVTLSAVLLLIDYLKYRKFSQQALLDKVPFFLLSMFFGLLAVFATHTEAQMEVYNDYTFWERIQYAAFAFIFYIYKTILPLNLSSIYPYPYLSGSLPLSYWLYPVLALLITGCVFWSAKITRKVVFGFGWFLIAVIFVLQLMPVYNALVADRYTYLSSVGLAFIAQIG